MFVGVFWVVLVTSGFRDLMLRLCFAGLSELVVDLAAMLNEVSIVISSLNTWEASVLVIIMMWWLRKVERSGSHSLTYLYCYKKYAHRAHISAWKEGRQLAECEK